ncbi:MAG: hypothetical protein LBH19_09025 [Dysgonamonadaceae bacterium]|jgi:hypothetical protein|nr:hypothetical protein [Dysgonamonadaceae bacterium]
MKQKFICGITVFILFFNVLPLSAQQEYLSGKQFYAEMGGPGLTMSVHFDSRFRSMERLGLGYRVGIGFTIYPDEAGGTYINSNYQTRTLYSIPLGINYIFGKNDSPHTFEIGAGTAVLTRKVEIFSYNEGERQGHFIGFFTFMYRRAPQNGGLTWRIGLTPLIGTSGDLYPMASIGFGYAF